MPILFKLVMQLCMIALIFALLGDSSLAQNTDRAGLYSDEVIAQAEKFLNEAGLRRNGKAIVPESQPTQLRNIGSIAKKTNELKNVQKQLSKLQETKKQMAAADRELNRNLRDVNIRMAIPNLKFNEKQELIAANNALVAQLEEMHAQEEELEKNIDEVRAAFQNLESDFIEEVLKARNTLDESKKSYSEHIEEKNLKIAFQVMEKEFHCGANMEVEVVFKTIENRLKELEEGFIREPVKLIKDGDNTRKIAVAINGKSPIEMILDSGASIILLPKSAADQLRITIPDDAPEAMMQVADGRAIPARIVTLESVRVGKFQVSDVEAAILDSEQASIEPLLGMSFLGRFQFQVKAAENELWLTQLNIDQGK